MKIKDGTSSERLYSLDALRGFDMFWIMGGEGIITGLAIITGWPFFEWCAKQLEHVPWHGFVFYDMIFPLFLFIAGISFPFSLARRLSLDKNRTSIHKHIVIRGLVLVILGILYNNGVRFDTDDLRYGSVLGRIGLAWMFAALIYMNSTLTWRIVWLFVLLLGYWFALMLFALPGSADIYSQETNFASYIDRLIMPGKLYLGNHDPGGLISTIPAIGTALLGMFTGEFMLSSHYKPYRRVLYLFIAALILIITGLLWNLVFPINKNLWTSSFVCFAGGLSLLLFTLFYLVIDVLKLKRWAFFFVVIGLNPITIYLTERIIGFGGATRFFFGGFMEIFPESWTPLIHGVGLTTIAWLFLYFLFRKKIFLKI